MEQYILVLWLGVTMPYSSTSSTGATIKTSEVGPLTFEECTKIAYAIEHATDRLVIVAGCRLPNQAFGVEINRQQ
jgi:hypothetical protein